MSKFIINNIKIFGGIVKFPVKKFFTSRCTAVTKMVLFGSVKEIAAERNSSIHTITTHKKNIFRKLQINSVYEATKYALRAGLLEMVEYYI